MSIFRRRPSALSSDDVFHKYVADITQMRRERQSLQQAVILKQPGAVEELQRTDTMIALAQTTIIRLEAKRQAQEAQS